MPDVMEMLAARVPLTLLMDLLDARGPHSEVMYADEPADCAWTLAWRRAA